MVDFINGARLRALADPHMAGFAAQTRALAICASMVTAHARQVFAHHAGIGFFVTAREVGNDAFEGVLFRNLLALGGARFHDVTELDVFFARAPQNAVTHCFCQRFKRCLHIKRVMLGQALEHAEVKTIAPVPALDGATGQAQTGEGHHAVNVKHFGGAQAIARGASAHGRVE